LSDAQLYAIVIGAIGMGAAALKLAQMALRRNGRNGNRAPKVGDMDLAVWEVRIRTIVHSENEDLLSHMRQLMESRNMTVREKVTDPIIAAIEKSRHDMRNVVGEAIANAYREARRKDG
jgi:hypothetical protein